MELTPKELLLPKDKKRRMLSRQNPTWWPWCSGNTAGCGPVITGSIPVSHPTKNPPAKRGDFCGVANDGDRRVQKNMTSKLGLAIVRILSYLVTKVTHV